MDVGEIMRQALDGAWMRNELLASNVANAETPGYKRMDVDFIGYLRSALGERGQLRPVTTNPRHMVGVSAGTLVATQDTTSVTPDGNNVDMDKEMAEVSTNAMYYEAVSQQLSSYFGLLRKGITEGRQ